MENTPGTQNNEGEIVDAILNGKKITQLADETGLDVNYIHHVLTKRNIYYEDVLEKRRGEGIKNKLAEMHIKLKVNGAETLCVPVPKRKKDVNEIEMEYAILKEVENDESLRAISEKYRISTDKITRILFDHGIKYSDLRQIKKMEKLEVLFKTKSESIPANAHLTEADLPSLYKAVLFDIIRIAKKIQSQPKIVHIKQYGHFLPGDIRNITGSFTMCCRLLQFNAYGKARFVLSMSEAEFDDILKNYLEKTSQIKADDELEKNNYAVMKKQVKEEKMILFLKKLAEELGRPPMKRDLIQRKMYMSYYHTFGSLSAALEKAGLQRFSIVKRREKENRKRLSTELRPSFIEKARELYSKLGRTPLPQELSPETDFKNSEYAEIFGSYPSFCKAAGFKIPFRYKGSYYSDDYLFETLRKIASEIGHSPTLSDLKKLAPFSYMVLVRRFGTYGNGIKRAGLEPISRIQYTKEELLDMLRQIAEKKGRRPRTNDLREPGVANYPAFQAKFGGFNKALELIGYNINEPCNDGNSRNKQYTEEMLISWLKDFAGTHNRNPRSVDFKNPSYLTFRKYFGTMKAAFSKAGLEVKPAYAAEELLNNKNIKNKRYTEEILINWLRDFEAEHKRNPCIKDFKSPSYLTFKKYFGTMKAAFSKAGLAVKHVYTAEELIARLKSLTPDQLINLHSIDLKVLGLPDKNELIKTFGSLEAARHAAGFDKKIYVKQELLGTIKQFYLIHNRAPMSKDFGTYNLPAIHFVYNLFENLHAAFAEAGINVSKHHNAPISDTELIDRLKKFAVENKRAPKPGDFKNGILPSYSTYYLRFGSIKNALAQAGIDDQDPKS